MRNKNTILSITIISVFILFGSSMTSAFGLSIENVSMDSEECTLCANPSPGCESCGDAVDFAVDYMLDNIDERLPGQWYLLRSLDAAILVVDLLIEGFVESGYNVQLNAQELVSFVRAEIEDHIGMQIFRITRFLATIIVIAIATTAYLLDTICGGGGSAQSSPVAIPQSQPAAAQTQSTQTSTTAQTKSTSATKSTTTSTTQSETAGTTQVATRARALSADI